MSERVLIFGDDELTVTTSREGAAYRVSSGDQTDRIEVLSLREGEAELRVNGRRVLVPYLVTAENVQFVYEGETWIVGISEGPRRRRRHKEHSMRAPMPGVVLKIFVNAGHVVTKGTPLLILEAMKMEHQLAATYDGTVRAVHCQPGELVQPGIDLISIDPAEES